MANVAECCVTSRPRVPPLRCRRIVRATMRLSVARQLRQQRLHGELQVELQLTPGALPPLPGSAKPSSQGVAVAC